MTESSLRVAVVEHPLLAERVACTLERMGAKVFRIPVAYRDPWRLVEELGVDFLFAINLVNWGGSREAKHRLFERLPHCCWVVDPLVNHTKTVFNPDLIHPNYHIFSYDSTLVPIFQAHGFENVQFLPLAPDGEQLPFPEEQSFLHDVCYVGRSLLSVGNEYLTSIQPEIRRRIEGSPNLEERRRWECVLQIFEQGIACQNEDLFEYILPQAMGELSQALGVEFPPPEWVAANPHLTSEGLVAVAAKQCCMAQRLLMVQSLSEAGVAVDLYGFQDWELIAGPHLPYRGAVENGDACMAIFRQSRICLNATRVYARSGIPGRIFDTAAAGSLVVTDYVPELESLFTPGKEIVCYESFAELVDRVRFYLQNEDERLAIARAGYERVWKDHTMESRLREILSAASKNVAPNP